MTITQGTSPDAVVLSRPRPGEHVVMRGMAGAALRLAFGPDVCSAFHNGRNLVFLFRDGAILTLEEFLGEEGGSGEIVIVQADGTPITFLEFMELFGNTYLERGRSASLSGIGSGLEAYLDDPGKLIGDLPSLGSLGTDHWGKKFRIGTLPIRHRLVSSGAEPENPPKPVLLAGTLRAEGSMFEDGQPFKFLLAKGADPARGSADHTLQDGFNPVTGMPFSFSLTGAKPGTTVYSLTMARSPPPGRARCSTGASR